MFVVNVVRLMDVYYMHRAFGNLPLATALKQGGKQPEVLAG